MPRKFSKPSVRSTDSHAAQRRIYVLDTNVLMHDPAAIFRFDEHDIYLPMVVLEELDHHKKGVSESARNVRQVSRFLDDIMQDADKADIDRGLPIPSGAAAATAKRPSASVRPAVLPDAQPAGQPARRNCRAAPTTTRSSRRPSRCRPSCRACASRWCRRTSTCASRRPSSASTPRTTTATAPSTTPTCWTRARARVAADFWQRHGENMRSWKEGGRTLLRTARPGGRGLARQPVRLRGRSDQGLEAMVRSVEGDHARLELVQRLPQQQAQRLGHHARATANRTSR